MACRFDWHQTGQFVTISVFAKVADPEQTSVEANGVVVNVKVVFDSGQSVFQQRFCLHGVSTNEL